MPSEPGAPPPEETVPLSVPEIQGNEGKYLQECLDSNWVSSAGPFVDRFEAMLAASLGRRYAVATVNGTAALHMALLVAGVQPDDEVLVSTLTFIAPANAVRYCGAWPVFVDAEPDFWQVNADLLATFLEGECRWKDGVLSNVKTGRPIRAILPVHILGHPVDLDPILEVARKFDLPVIEDAAEGLGSLYKDHPVGGLGDLGCLSFNGNKIITSGGGGMIVTDNEAWADRAKHLTTQARTNPQEYMHDEPGYNYRLTNLQAALGLAQLERLEEHVAAKRRTAEEYSAALGEIEGINPMKEAAWARSIFWLYTVTVDPEAYGTDARGLMRALAKQGIESRPLWQPLHTSAAHRDCQAIGGDVAEGLYRNALSLPSSVGLTSVQQARVIEAIAARQG